jgi:hypothetical protein
MLSNGETIAQKTRYYVTFSTPTGLQSGGEACLSHVENLLVVYPDPHVRMPDSSMRLIGSNFSRPEASFSQLREIRYYKA